MSHLEIGPALGMGDISYAALDLFGLRAKEARKTVKEQGKHQRALEAQTFEQKRLLSQDQATAAAVENFRAKVINKLRELEKSAIESADVMENAREIASQPLLAGDPVLGKVDREIAELETAVIQIQAGTIVDTGTFDTQELAVSYSNAQSAVVAMDAVLGRAKGIVEDLALRLRDLKAEHARAERTRKEQALLMIQETKRAEQAERERVAREARNLREEERQRRVALIQRLRELEGEILREKRRLRQAKSDLAETKRRASETARKRAEFVARAASMQAQRATLRSRGVPMGV